MFRRRLLFTGVTGFTFLSDQPDTRKSVFQRNFCLPEKRYYSIVRIASVYYVQAENYNTRLHKIPST